MYNSFSSFLAALPAKPVRLDQFMDEIIMAIPWDSDVRLFTGQTAGYYNKTSERIAHQMESVADKRRYLRQLRLICLKVCQKHVTDEDDDLNLFTRTFFKKPAVLSDWKQSFFNDFSWDLYEKMDMQYQREGHAEYSPDHLTTFIERFKQQLTNVIEEADAVLRCNELFSENNIKVIADPFEGDTGEQDLHTGPKLHWMVQVNQAYDTFRELKRDGWISNTDESLAHFIYANFRFEGGNHPSRETIERQLKSKERPLKSKRYVRPATSSDHGSSAEK
jgi:hypothetical protein